MMRTVVLRVRPRRPASGGGWHVRLFELGPPPRRVASGVVPPAIFAPTSSIVPEALLATLATQRGRSLDFESGGRALHDALLQPRVRTRWRQIAAGGPVRTVLDLRDPVLAALPWELACDDRDMRPGLDPATPIVRWARPARRPVIAPAAWPLRLLVVVAADAADPDVQAGPEVAAITDALRPLRHAIDLEVIERPSQTALRELCQRLRPHVLHVVGHGATNPLTGRPVLKFAAGSAAGDTAWTWSASDIRADLALIGWAPSFVCLNTCRSQKALDPSRALSDAFLQLGALAVVGMQADIDGRLAGHFSSALYRRIAEGLPIDVAVVHARNEVRSANNPGGLEKRDWALPVLSVTVAPETALPVPSATALLAKSVPALMDVSRLVDRHDERRGLLYGCFPIAPPDPPHHVVVVTGPPHSGKSALVHWYLAGCAWQGHEVRLLEIADGRPQDLLSLLRLVRDGDPQAAVASFLHAGLDVEAFHRFNWEVTRLLKSGTGGPWDGQPCLDPGHHLTDANPAVMQCLFDAFLDALDTVSRTRTLVVALDRFRHAGTRALAPSEWRSFVVPHLIEPLAAGRLPRVRVVVAMNHDDARGYGLVNDDLTPALTGVKVVRVEWMKKGEFVPLAREFFSLAIPGGLVPPLDTIVDSLIAGRLNFLPDPWMPGELTALKGIVDQLRGMPALGF